MLPVHASLARQRRALARRSGQLRGSGLLLPLARVSRAPIAVVYGNCQAEPTRRMLTSLPRSELRAVRTPSAHMAGPNELRRLLRFLPAASFFIAQPVRDDYRGLPLGTEQLARYLPADVRRVSIPSIYFRGYHPYLVYVNSSRWDRHRAAMAEYHDLRHIEAARRGLTGRDGVTWVLGLDRPKRYLQATWDDSLAELRRREALLDVKLSDALVSCGMPPMFTLNHPPAALMAEQASRIQAVLGLRCAAPKLGREQLGHMRIPADFDGRGEDTGAAVPAGQPRSWLIRGTPVPESEVIAANLERYRNHPGVLNAALDQHCAALRSIFAGVV